MVAGDGTSETEQIIHALHQKYSYGEWVEVKKTKSVTYTGRTITIVGDEIHLRQEDYIQGRMSDDPLPSKKKANRSLSDECTPQEKADFKSITGDMHWLTSQTRPDHAANTSCFQKRQNKP